MRATYNPEAIIENGVFLGFNLGADYCAEHEWGIRDLARDLGLPTGSDVFGIKKYTITKQPSLMRVLRYQSHNVKYVSILVHTHSWLNEYDDKRLRANFAPQGNVVSKTDTDFASATWGEEGFAITVPYKYRECIYKLEQAIKNNDLALFFMKTKNNPFSNAGLCVMIASLVPEELKEAMLARDKNAYELINAAAKTGIEAQIKASGKDFFALSPRWVKDLNGDKKTKYPVAFWLNPYNQNKYASGYFTVEELQLWCEDKGPVVRQDVLKMYE